MIIGHKNGIMPYMTCCELNILKSPENPSFQKQTYVFEDSTITQPQKEIIRRGINELFEFLGFDKNKIEFLNNNQFKNKKFNLDLSFDEILGKFINQNKVNVDYAISCIANFEPFNKNWFVSFTNKDIYNPNNNYMFGGSVEGFGSLISLNKYEQYIKEPYLNEAIKSLIFHEIGHILGLVTNRRNPSKLETNVNGVHCLDPQCSMKYSKDEEYAEIYAKIRHQFKSPPFCPECLTDLAVLRKQ